QFRREFAGGVALEVGGDDGQGDLADFFLTGLGAFLLAGDIGALEGVNNVVGQHEGADLPVVVAVRTGLFVGHGGRKETGDGRQETGGRGQWSSWWGWWGWWGVAVWLEVCSGSWRSAGADSFPRTWSAVPLILPSCMSWLMRTRR